MAQSPFQADAIQIEPGAAGTRLIERDSTTGEIKFTDVVVTTGITLAQLAGIGSIADVHIVGKSGAGAEYTTVQAAVDAVPVTASVAAPHLIIITNGVFTENVLIEKDGIFFFAPGGAEIVNNGAADTVTYQQGAASTPTRSVWINVRIKNTAAGRACVKLIGGAGSNVALDRFDLKDCDLLATGVGSYQIDANAINNLYVAGGNWTGSDANSICKIAQTAEFTMTGTRGVNNLELNYDSTGAVPATATTLYTLGYLSDALNLTSTLSGAGSIDLYGCKTGTLLLNGDQTLTASFSALGNMTINNTMSVVLKHTSRGTAVGVGTLAETSLVGSQVFAASAIETVTFTVPQPDTAYMVALERDVDARVVTTNKVAASFDIVFPAGVQTTTVSYTVSRGV